MLFVKSLCKLSMLNHILAAELVHFLNIFNDWDLRLSIAGTQIYELTGTRPTLLVKFHITGMILF